MCPPDRIIGIPSALRCPQVSVGAASLVPSAQTSMMELIAKADTALYAAKSLGRNRTYPDNTRSSLAA